MNAKDSGLPFNDGKTRVLAQILSEAATVPITSILVVGCGKGFEAAVLGDSLRACSTGIDIDPEFDQLASEYAELRLGDALRMEFPDEHFDAVYSFHALEHISDHRQALREMHRVLRKGGVWLIGTPNRERIIGYVGSKGASLLQKIRWNVADWKARLKGEFRNEFGAHAGFSVEELRSDLSDVFGAANDVSMLYYQRIYAGKQRLIRALGTLGITRWAFPAVYFTGNRQSED